MLQEIDSLNNQAHRLEMDHWLHQDVFSFQWWLILIVNVLFFVLFLYFIDRRRIFQIALAFTICLIIDGTFDDIGKYFAWWTYPHQLFQFTARFNAVNVAVIPSAFALMYQMFGSWRKYLIADIIVSIVYSYIGLPIFVFLGITKLNSWTHYKSFLFLIVIGILTKAITDFIAKMKLPSNHLEIDDRTFNLNFLQKKEKAR